MGDSAELLVHALAARGAKVSVVTSAYLIAANPLEECVKITGHVDRSSVAEYLDFFLNVLSSKGVKVSLPFSEPAP